MKRDIADFRRSARYFNPSFALRLGSLAIALGVCLHLPMFFHAAAMEYKMVGMPMDAPMVIGMVLIVIGTVVATYGLIPRNLESPQEKKPSSPANIENIRVRAMDDARLGPAHWKMLAVLSFALIIDVMKPATLGFVMPGMAEEYGIPKSTVALLPLIALIGTVTGSIAWGLLGDIIGRRGSILLASLIFIGTAICGAMPSFVWNVVMCFVMGLSAGGLLPIVFTLLQKWSTKHSLVLFTIMTAMSLLGFVTLGENITSYPTVLIFLIVTLLITVNGSISMLLPYSAEVYPSHVRATGAGMVAGSTKMGGVVGLGAAIVTLVPGLAPAALFAAVPALLSAILLNKNGIETRGIRLEEIRVHEA